MSVPGLIYVYYQGLNMRLFCEIDSLVPQPNPNKSSHSRKPNLNPTIIYHGILIVFVIEIS